MTAFFAVVPARLASIRLPNKPLADIAGKPMVVRVAERALQSGALRVVVATDHESVAAACRQHQVEALMTRADHLSGTDRLAEVAAQMQWPADAIVVMGAAQWDGRPSPVLQARLDHALDLYRRGLAPLVVVTGGKQQIGRAHV